MCKYKKVLPLHFCNAPHVEKTTLWKRPFFKLIFVWVFFSSTVCCFYQMNLSFIFHLRRLCLRLLHVYRRNNKDQQQVVGIHTDTATMKKIQLEVLKPLFYTPGVCDNESTLMIPRLSNKVAASRWAALCFQRHYCADYSCNQWLFEFLMPLWSPTRFQTSTKYFPSA